MDATRTTLLGTALGLAIGFGCVGGCVSYTNVPVPNSAPAFKHANSGASIKVIVASIDRVVLRHPMRDRNGNYAVNLPAGTTPETANTIVSRLPDGAIVPFEGMSDTVPVYHISRVWLRGSSGKVDVVYPIDHETDGGVTVWVHGGDQPWYVERLQFWAPGTIPTPPVYVPIDGTGTLGSDAGTGTENQHQRTEPQISEPEIEEPPREEIRNQPEVVEPDPSDDGVLYREIKGGS